MLEVIEEVLRENEDIIIDMNVEDQLYERGVDRHGRAIIDYAPYSPVTIEYKKLKGQPTSRVTLRDSGDFHHSFFIKFGNEGFKIDASDSKTDDLLSSYGDAILGLTKENFADLAENYIKPELAKLFRKV